MHLDGLGDIRQYHRFHKFFALLKEGLLLLNNTTTDAQQGVVAAFEAFNQPLRILQIGANKLAVGIVARTITHGA